MDESLRCAQPAIPSSGAEDRAMSPANELLSPLVGEVEKGHNDNYENRILGSLSAKPFNYRHRGNGLAGSSCHIKDPRPTGSDPVVDGFLLVGSKMDVQRAGKLP